MDCVFLDEIFTEFEFSDACPFLQLIFKNKFLKCFLTDRMFIFSNTGSSLGSDVKLMFWDYMGYYLGMHTYHTYVKN